MPAPSLAPGALALLGCLVGVGLDVGPLTSVVRVLERQGVIVTKAQLDTNKVDAFSRWLNERPVVVLASDNPRLFARSCRSG
jgi:hypothetical protein